MLVCVGYTYGLGTAGVPNIGRLTGRKKTKRKKSKNVGNSLLIP